MIYPSVTTYPLTSIPYPYVYNLYKDRDVCSCERCKKCGKVMEKDWMFGKRTNDFPRFVSQWNGGPYSKGWFNFL